MALHGLFFAWFDAYLRPYLLHIKGNFSDKTMGLSDNFDMKTRCGEAKTLGGSAPQMCILTLETETVTEKVSAPPPPRHLFRVASSSGDVSFGPIP